MKKFLVIVIITFFGFFSATAQTEIPSAKNVEVAVINNNLTISWESNNTQHVNWKLEASIDNENFKAIGWVLGAMPGKANAFAFKQATNKLTNKFKYYRVVAVEHTGNGWAGTSVQITK